MLYFTHIRYYNSSTPAQFNVERVLNPMPIPCNPLNVFLLKQVHFLNHKHAALFTLNLHINHVSIRHSKHTTKLTLLREH